MIQILTAFFFLFGSIIHVGARSFGERYSVLPPTSFELLWGGVSFFFLIVSVVLFLYTFNLSTIRRRILAVFVAFAYFLEFFFNFYRNLFKYDFDINFILYNRANVITTLLNSDKNSVLIFVTITLALAGVTFGITKVFLQIKPGISYKYISLSIVIILQIGAVTHLSLFRIFYEFIRSRQTSMEDFSGIYINAYNNNLTALKKPSGITLPSNGYLPNNIILLQLESLNALTVNPVTTPNMYRIKDMGGALFKNVQSAGVLTAYSQESILCSSLPSLTEPHASFVAKDEDLNCLPNIMRKRGYTTFYIQGFDVQFSNTIGFMRAAGFDHVLEEELFNDTNIELLWGYKDEDLIDRSIKYLTNYKKEHPEEKIFVHIVLGAVNHHPFWSYAKEAYPELISEVPYQNPSDVFEKISNTTYIQDKFLGVVVDWIASQNGDSDLLVFGDHSWPVGKHDGNILAGLAAYQENFVTSGALLSSSPKFSEYKAKEFEGYISQLDYVPTLLSLYGIEHTSLYGENVLRPDYAPQNRCLISAQPYGGRYVSLIKYPFKYLYHRESAILYKTNLVEDPLELNPEHLPVSEAEYLEDCLFFGHMD